MEARMNPSASALFGHPDIDGELNQTTSRLHQAEVELERLQQEENARRDEMLKTQQQIEHLQQLKRFAAAEEKMKQAQAQMYELENTRLDASMSAVDASQELVSLQEQLYEIPIQDISRSNKPKITELQVQAYLERHEMDQLLEDLLASVIEHMPAYPMPFMIALIKRKAGVMPDTSSNNYKAMLDQTVSEHKTHLEDLDKQHEASLKDIENKYEAELHNADLLREQLEHELELANDKIRQSQEQLQKQQVRLEELQKQLQDSRKEQQSAGAVAAELQSEKLRNADLDAKLAAALIDQAKAKTTRQELERLSGELERSEQQLQQARSKIETSKANASGQVQQLSKDNDSLSNENEKLSKENDRITKENTALVGHIESAKRDQAAQERKIKELTDRLNAASKDLTKKVAEAEEHNKAAEAKARATAKENERKMKELEEKRKEAEAKAIESDSLAETFKEAPLVYNISVRTGDVRWAGTDARVFLQIFGENGQTDKLKLAKSEGHRDKFERSKIDKFIMKANHVGALKNIVIGHDGHGMGSGWYVDWVRIEIPSLGKHFQFVADRWLSTSEGDGKLQCKVELDPTFSTDMNEVKGSSIARVRTGTVSGASLDNAHVFLQIYGETDHSEEIKLVRPKADPKHKDFQKGALDEFRIEAGEVGKMQKIRLWHDSKGIFGASWYLEDVELHDLKTDIRYVFRGALWIDKKQPIAELPVATTTYPDGTVEENDAGMTVYTVEVQTGSVKSAGTDANVHIMIVGEDGDTGDRPLKKSLNHHFDKFRKGQLDIFEVKAINLGKLKRVKIWHDNKDIMSPDWYLASVKITDGDSGESTEFPCDAWLSKKMGLVKELVPVTTAHEEFQITKGAGVDYHITVVTGSVKEAGTDAHVYIVLYGEHADTGKVELKKSKEHSDPFQRGSTDSFTINAVDVGDIRKINISHDGHRAGLATNPSWFIDRIEVDAPTLGKKFVFPAELWLDKSKGEGTLEKDLFPGAGGASDAVTEYKPKKAWQVEVQTSNEKKAGTDADVTAWVTFKDDNGNVTEQVLDFKNQATKDSFEKGRLDKFRFELEDCGSPFKLRISHNGAHGLSHGLMDGADWHVATVALIDAELKERFEFEFDDWLKKKGDMLERGVSSGTKLDETADTIVDLDTTIQLGEVKYTINVTTDSGKKSGTDANISVQMIGENGTSGTYILTSKNCTEPKKNLFEAGQTDSFVVGPMVPLGRLNKIKVTSDGHKGMSHIMSTDWTCAVIEIVQGASVSTFKFRCDQKFSKKTGMDHVFKVSDVSGAAAEAAETPKKEKPRKTSLQATARRPSGSSTSGTPRTARKTKRGKPDPAEVTYVVTTFTANVKNAGTDARIEATLKGSKGVSSVCKLEKSLTNRDKFEKGKSDKFKFPSIKFCGRLKEIKLTSDNHRGAHLVGGADWLCEKVEVVEDRGGGKTKTFTFTNTDERWISKKKGLSLTLPVDSSEDTEDDEYLAGARSAASMFSESEAEQ